MLKFEVLVFDAEETNPILFRSCQSLDEATHYAIQLFALGAYGVSVRSRDDKGLLILRANLFRYSEDQTAS